LHPAQTSQQEQTMNIEPFQNTACPDSEQIG
jgi:hypothetical protein